MRHTSENRSHFCLVGTSADQHIQSKASGEWEAVTTHSTCFTYNPLHSEKQGNPQDLGLKISLGVRSCQDTFVVSHPPTDGSPGEPSHPSDVKWSKNEQ